MILPTDMMRRIKAIHSAIWVMMVCAIFYILYAGITDRIDAYLLIPVSLMALEGVVLFMNKGSCPLTIVAKRIKKDYADGDDIYLPKWVAIHNKAIFGSILLAGILMIVYRLLV